MLSLSETACNIPMPSNVKPPKSKAVCDSCEHEKVCKYSENMERFAKEISDITNRIERSKYMWKVIQGDEKAGFIKDVYDKKIKLDDTVLVDMSCTTPEAVKMEEASAIDFVSDDIVILVKAD
ncbi:hypothetical protein QE152_g38985 [Popillia japonica]|uniref:Uncharacterized protein n=1 Tax=Popillia japonica TaxID=7064 RepID=A0AAW1HVF7_POPJA